MSDADHITKVIFRYAALIGGEQDSEKLLHLNAGMARDLVGADRCSIWMADPGSGELWTKVAHGSGEIRVPRGHGLVGSCVEKGEPVLVNDTSSDPRFLKRVDKGSGYETLSVLVIPLRAGDGAVIGAFQALNKPGGFSERDIDLLSLAASYSAAAIETQRLRQEAIAARIVMHEIKIAGEVQQQLFPQNVPGVKGLDFAAACRPTKLVGGDYYDLLPLPGDSLAMTLGDVSGKGIAAAVMMASIQSALRSQLMRTPESLGALLTDFNKVVYSSSTPDRYSTLFCALLDGATRRLTFVICGHLPPMVLRAATNKVERLDGGGFPIGLLPIAHYEQSSVELQPGDLMVCFSDGISEAANAKDEMWDESEVAKVLLESGGLSARETVDRLFAAADAFAAGAEQSDDMTVLAVRACG